MILAALNNVQNVHFPQNQRKYFSKEATVGDKTS